MNNTNAALRMLFVGELLPRLLKLGGPALISQLRGVSDCREAIDDLADEVKKDLGLPVLGDELNIDSVVEGLRHVLTEPVTTPFSGKNIGYSTLSHVTFLAMAASPLTSQRAMLNMIGQTCSNITLLDTIAANPSASPIVLARIFDISIERGVTFDSPPDQVLLNLSKHPNTPTTVLDTLLESVPDANDGNWLTDTTFYDVAKHRNTSREYLVRKLSEQRVWDGTMPPDTMMMNKEQTFWIGAGDNENVSRYGLVPILLSRKDQSVWVRPAMNKCTSPEDLRLLSKFEPTLRESPFATLYLTARERRSRIIAIRAAVAANPNTDEETLDYLLDMNNKGPLGLNDEEREMELGHISARDFYSPGSPVDNFAEGIRDRVDLEKIFSVQKSAGHRSILARHSKNKETLASLVGTDDGSLDAYLAENMFTPADALAELSESANVSVREKLARNRKAPSEILSALSKDEEISVRAAILENPSVTEQVLREMYSDITNDEGKHLIVNHENFSKRIRNEFMATAVQDGVFVDLYHVLDQILFRWRDELPEDLLAAASRGTLLPRLSVASNRRLPIEDVARLCTDDSVTLPYHSTLPYNSYGRTINNPLVQLAVDNLSSGLSIEGVVFVNNQIV